MTLLVVGGIVLIALVISPAGRDSFRLPKEILIRAEAILITALVVALAPLHKIWQALLPPYSLSDIFVATVIVWTTIVTATSTNYRQSAESLLWVCCCAAIFLATRFVARPKSVLLTLAVTAPALINSSVVILQSLGRLSILKTPPGLITGFLGNPNDVGSFLTVPVVAESALAITDTRRRFIHLIIALGCAVGLITSHAVTAIVACCAGIAAIGFVFARRQTLTLIGIAIVVATLAMTFYRPLREAMSRRTSLTNSDAFLSGRLGAFAAAFEMIKRHPLTGVGPGCFGWQYFPYKLKAEAKFPSVLHPVQFSKEGIQKFPPPARILNFAETHSDHLQTAAVAGIPGYVLFLIAIGMVARSSFMLHDETTVTSPERRFAMLSAFPLAVTFFVLTLAQFPLELAAPTAGFIFLFALCDAWRSV